MIIEQITYNNFIISGSRMSGGFARIWTMTMWVLSFQQFDPDDYRFSHPFVYANEL